MSLDDVLNLQIHHTFLFYNAGKSSFPVLLPKPMDINISVDNSNPHVNLNSVHPVPSVDAGLEKMV